MESKLVTMKLSIITINKDNAKGFERTALSVMWQTFTDFEWIVIDGASNDGSVEIIKKYARKMACWVSEPDTGVYNAMNKGIKRAKGEYCLFLNSGDWLFSPDVLESVFLEIKDKQADIFYGDYLFRDFSLGKVPEVLSMDYFFTHGSISHQNSIIKRSLFLEHGSYKEEHCTISDAIFFMEEFYKYNSLFHHIKTKMGINDIFFLSRINSKSAMQELRAIMKDLMGISEYNLMLKRCSSLFIRHRNTKKMSLKLLMKYILPYGVVRIIQKHNTYKRTF